jgi:hypothetical protein
MLHVSGDSSEMKLEHSGLSLMRPEEFCSHHERVVREQSSIFINLTEAEKIVIQSLTFLEQKTNEEEEL